MKIFANLGWAGYLGDGGTIVAGNVPADAAQLRLTRDFSAHLQ